MMAVIDQPARRRFVNELDRNFSVIASAGSGKTRAITDRIVRLAQHPRALEWLPQLVIVTYTNRAADQMQLRTRQQILDTGLPLEIVEAFNRAFFGTIHSFCVKLLNSYGHYLGLPPALDLITDDTELWEEFVQQQTRIGRSLTEENRRVLLRHVQVRQLMELARNFDGNLAATEPNCPCPDTDFSEIYRAVARGQMLRTIPKAQEQLRQWEQRWRETGDFVPWPPCATTSREFVERWREAFRPLRDWVSACAMCVAAEIQLDYRNFRLERGVVTYRDQIALAADLLHLPNVAKELREKDYRVILDEAQDTEPAQFFVLIEITRPSEARGSWVETHSDPPRAGHFCMVGDFQQSIYRDAAELAHYRKLHRSFTSTGAAEELTFSVTFRLDQAQLQFVNKTFREILNKAEGQVEFVELSPRPDVLPGQVIRLDLDDAVNLNLSESQRARLEAQKVAEWIKQTGPGNVRAESWRHVAILCPRKAWLRAMRDALLALEVPVVVHSETERNAENPAYAWLTALLVIMVRPYDSYEIVGGLREIFGISDDELARFADGKAARFQIARTTRGRGPAVDALNSLTRTRESIQQQPLFSAIREIVTRTQLRERLRSLPAEEFPEALDELERLLAAAAASEALCSSLSEFTTLLRTNFHSTRETHPSRRDAIQLITAHKAKGSEWQAVIVPFLSREVRVGSSAYPRLIKTNEPRIVFDRTDVSDFEEDLERSERQEMERLLYVALTRAKHTVVLAYDRNYFLGARGQVHEDTQLKWLRADAGQANAETFSALSIAPAECAITRDLQAAVPEEAAVEELAALRLETGWLDRARRCSSRFIHTITPSRFKPADDEEPGSEDADEQLDGRFPDLLPPRTDNPATRYGLWWHGFAQRLPWRSGLTKCREFFDVEVAGSPDPARARREWTLLYQQLERNPAFKGLFEPTFRTLAEMPFFWMAGSLTCLEGIVDLALFDYENNRVLILDWKTNRIDSDAVVDLRIRYRPQMAAYWRAVIQLSGATVNAAIYSTAVGQLIVYENNELDTEWQRLSKLAATELANEIRGADELL
jgi:ATP-dependent helicase/nuclease subunit A